MEKDQWTLEKTSLLLEINELKKKMEHEEVLFNYAAIYIIVGESFGLTRRCLSKYMIIADKFTCTGKNQMWILLLIRSKLFMCFCCGFTTDFTPDTYKVVK